MKSGALLLLLGAWVLSRRRDESTGVDPLPLPTPTTGDGLELTSAQLAAIDSHARGETQPLEVPTATHDPAVEIDPTPRVEPSPPAIPPREVPEGSTIVDGRWTLSPSLATLADSIARSGDVPNRQGSPLRSADLREAQLPLSPGLDEFARYLRTHTGLRVGTARGRSVQAPALRADGTLRNRDVHEEGRAADIMTSNQAIGSRIADWLLRNARVLGVQQIIWHRGYWSSATPRRGRSSFGAYTGRSPHIDHVHVELSPQWAFDVARLRAALAAITPPERAR